MSFSYTSHCSLCWWARWLLLWVQILHYSRPPNCTCCWKLIPWGYWCYCLLARQGRGGRALRKTKRILKERKSILKTKFFHSTSIPTDCKPVLKWAVYSHHWWEAPPFTVGFSYSVAAACWFPLGVSLNCSGLCLAVRHSWLPSLPPSPAVALRAAGRYVASMLSPCIINIYKQELAPGTSCATGLLPNQSYKETLSLHACLAFIVLETGSW